MREEKTSIQDWSEHVAGLLEHANDGKRLPLRLISAVKSLGQANSSFLTLYDHRTIPVQTWSDPPIPDEAAFLMNAYELDPIFEALTDDRPPGCIPVRDLPPA